MSQITEDEIKKIYKKLDIETLKKLEQFYARGRSGPYKKYVYIFGELIDEDDLGKNNATAQYKNVSI